MEQQKASQVKKNGSQDRLRLSVLSGEAIGAKEKCLIPKNGKSKYLSCGWPGCQE